jgi:hypothetical protein
VRGSEIPGVVEFRTGRKRFIARHIDRNKRNRLKTALVGDKSIPEFDKDIMTNLLITTVEEKLVRQEQMLIAVLNAKQEIYRVIGAADRKQFINAVEELEDLELSNELKEIDRVKNGYDAIFGLSA